MQWHENEYNRTFSIIYFINCQYVPNLNYILHSVLIITLMMTAYLYLHMSLCHVLFSVDFIQLIEFGYEPYEVVLFICPFTSEEPETQIHKLTFSESYSN